jgi:hypothetical protein
VAFSLWGANLDPSDGGGGDEEDSEDSCLKNFSNSIG